MSTGPGFGRGIPTTPNTLDTSTMNAPKTRGQGNNQSATSDLSIPTLGSSPAGGPVVQPGEDPEAMAALQDRDPIPPNNPAAALDQFIESTSSDSAPGTGDVAQDVDPKMGVPVAREMSNAEMQTVLMQILNAQAATSRLIEQLARNTPVMRRGDVDQYSEVPVTTLDMPITGDLDRMLRPDQRVEGVDIDVVRGMDHAAMLAFLEEYVVVNVAEASEEGAENPVVLHVNGRAVAIPRGHDMAIKRKYVELMLRAKPEGIKTRITRDGEGNTKNHIDKTRSLKYPFSIVLDRNPRGPAWARKIRAEA